MSSSLWDAFSHCRLRLCLTLSVGTGGVGPSANIHRECVRKKNVHHHHPPPRKKTHRKAALVTRGSKKRSLIVFLYGG